MSRLIVRQLSPYVAEYWCRCDCCYWSGPLSAFDELKHQVSGLHMWLCQKCELDVQVVLDLTREGWLTR